MVKGANRLITFTWALAGQSLASQHSWLWLTEPPNSNWLTDPQQLCSRRPGSSAPFRYCYKRKITCVLMYYRTYGTSWSYIGQVVEKLIACVVMYYRTFLLNLEPPSAMCYTVNSCEFLGLLSNISSLRCITFGRCCIEKPASSPSSPAGLLTKIHVRCIGSLRVPLGTMQGLFDVRLIKKVCWERGEKPFFTTNDSSPVLSDRR